MPAASLPFVLLVIAARGRLDRIKPVNVRLHLLRGALSVLMLYSFITAVRESSLATTYSIFMCAPLLVAVGLWSLRARRAALRRLYDERFARRAESGVSRARGALRVLLAGAAAVLIAVALVGPMIV
jgi:hypothetical protein